MHFALLKDTPANVSDSRKEQKGIERGGHKVNSQKAVTLSIT